MYFRPRREMDWQKLGKCYGEDGDRWLVANLNPLWPEREAEQLCRGCPVRQECREDAESPVGVYWYTGTYELDAELETVGVVRDGTVW